MLDNSDPSFDTLLFEATCRKSTWVSVTALGALLVVFLACDSFFQ
jgi:hypothetical protein